MSASGTLVRCQSRAFPTVCARCGIIYTLRSCPEGGIGVSHLAAAGYRLVAGLSYPNTIYRRGGGSVSRDYFPSHVVGS